MRCKNCLRVIRHYRDSKGKWHKLYGNFVDSNIDDGDSHTDRSAVVRKNPCSICLGDGE